MPALLIVVLFCILPVSTSAQDWGRYVNDLYDFSVEVPPGYAETERVGDGLIFMSADGTATMLATGGNSVDAIERLGERHMDHDSAQGWDLAIDGSTPGWVSYTGRRNGMILRVRLIPICTRWQYARLELRYPVGAMAEMERVMDRLAASLRPNGRADCPA